MKARHRRDLVRHGIPQNTIGLRLGWEANRNLSESWITVSQNDLKRSAYIIGATGAGKTTLLTQILAHDILRAHSFALIDHRGDLANGAIEMLARNPHPEAVAFLDLRERKRPLGFNPLSGNGEPYFRALGVLDAIESESSSWGVQLEETLRNALLALSACQESIPSIERLLTDMRFRRSISNRLEGRLRGFWEEFDLLSRERQLTLTTPALNKVSGLTSVPTLRTILGHPNPVDLASFLNSSGTAVLASLAVDELHSIGRTFGRLFLSSVSRELFARADVPESKRNSVRLVLDEFEMFQDELVEDILVQGRKYGIACLLAHQTLAQLGQKMRAIIFGNVGLIAAFRVSREDGAVLSRHMTGDPKAIDFASLDTGQCVLWKAGETPTLVECNAPLIPDFGHISAAGKEFRSHLRSSIPKHDPMPESPPIRRQASEKSQPNLEDWL